MPDTTLEPTPPAEPHAPADAGENPVEAVLERWRRARARRESWERHWQDCYDYALPQRAAPGRILRPGEKRTDRLFDGTAPDAVDQLAASLLAQLTPPWSRWFGLTAGNELPEDERAVADDSLDRVAAIMQSHFDRSNFAVEVHQCYLDLVTAGSASLLFEEAETGSPSAFRFAAVPLAELAFEEDPDGALSGTFRHRMLPVDHIRARFPHATLPEHLVASGGGDETRNGAGVLEAVLPQGTGFRYLALLAPEAAGTSRPVVLREGRFARSPFINFRWLKAPGETYGRSPVMKALPDIKTANKVVELILKNASIAVTGIWQADDDGVLNPATVRLIPGSIIPKAVGSAGLTPLEAPGRFDVSQLMLDDLRRRIRHALLADRLGQPDTPRMTATEVLERSAEMARLLGATYGRLQSELLTPLVGRALAILRRRREIPDIVIDGHTVEMQYRSPLARDQATHDVRNVTLWLEAIAALGPEANGVVDAAAAARWMGRTLNVPAAIIREPAAAGAGSLAGLADALVGTMPGTDPAAETADG